MSRYVCGIHLDQPVNFKGKGCPDCDADHEKRQAKKELEKKKRAARLRGEEYVEEDEER